MTTEQSLREMLEQIRSADAFESADISREIMRTVQDFRAATISNSVMGANLTNVTNVISGVNDAERKQLLQKLEREAGEMIHKLPLEKQEEAADNLKLLVQSATAEKPKRPWYSVSAQGLLDASKFAKDFSGNIAGTIGQLGRALWPDFTLAEQK